MVIFLMLFVIYFVIVLITFSGNHVLDQKNHER